MIVKSLITNGQFGKKVYILPTPSLRYTSSFLLTRTPALTLFYQLALSNVSTDTQNVHSYFNVSLWHIYSPESYARRTVVSGGGGVQKFFGSLGIRCMRGLAYAICYMPFCSACQMSRGIAALSNGFPRKKVFKIFKEKAKS